MAGANASLLALPDDQRLELESWLVQFDRSWQPGHLAAWVERLPPPESPLRLAALVEMVKIDLERQWEQGRQVPLESYLETCPELGTAQTVAADLIQAEYEVRCQFGVPADLAVFSTRFPRQADELERLIHEARQLITESELTALAQEAPAPEAPTPSAARPAPPPAELPEEFGRYRILMKLGEGGMGAVYLALDRQIDRQVALKIPRFSPEDGPEVLERFYREARSAGTIQHPNLCPVFDAGEIDGIHYLTMAYVEGKPLSKLFPPDEPSDQREVAVLVRKLALALEEAHRNGVIHRDLKPTNVMINEAGEPVIVDFGLARRVGTQEIRLTQSGIFLGTPAYMAPEQVRGDVEAMGPGCDVYSLGVILYELLCGRLPFVGPAARVLGDIQYAAPPRPCELRPDLDPALEAICQKAMAKPIEARYASMADLAAALDDYLESPGGKTRRAAQGRRWLWLALLGTGAGMLLLGLVIVVKVKFTEPTSLKPGGGGPLPLGEPAIYGSVWNDENGNGSWDRPSEQCLEGWRVYLDANSNGYLDAGERYQVTDADGHYSFTGLPHGTYRVAEVLSEGWEQTHPSAVVYQTDFSSDPGWVTNNPSRHQWDAADGSYMVTQVNINYGGEYAYYQAEYDGGSFVLEWDIKMLSNDYASAVSFGLYDSDLNSSDNGSYVHVFFVLEDEVPSSRRKASRIGLTYRNFQDIADATRSSEQFSYDTWYHVVMEYNAKTHTLSANIKERETERPLTSLSIADVGSFAPDMARVGTSNVRKGTFEIADIRSSAKLDNVSLSVSGLRLHRVRLSSGQRRQQLDFGNRQLAEIRGTKWNDLNADGVRDQGEPGLEGWAIYLDENLNGQWDPGERSEKTGANGEYSFTQLSAGTHIVAEQPQRDWVQTYPSGYDWKRYGGHLYALTKDRGTWQECEYEAVAAGGHLVTVNDAEENAWLAESFPVEPIDAQHVYSCQLWIGLQGIPDNLSWVNGEPVTYVARIYFGGWYPAGGPYAYLHPRTHQFSGMWWNSDIGKRPPSTRPHGIIELPRQIAGPIAHKISLIAGQIEEAVDFGSTLKTQP